MPDRNISVVMPILITEIWQLHMTTACILTMFDCTDVPFELVIVETRHQHFSTEPGRDARPDGSAVHKISKYIHIPEITNATHDINVGLEAASGDFLVNMANDVTVKPGWLEAMLECFEIPDCGIATLGAQELGHEPERRIMEGVYGPIGMFRKEWRYDEDYFPHLFADADMVMRVYAKGLRSYRNHRVVVTHPNQQTDRVLFTKEQRQSRFAEAKEAFIGRHHRSHLMMYRALTEGWPI